MIFNSIAKSWSQFARNFLLLFGGSLAISVLSILAAELPRSLSDVLAFVITYPSIVLVYVTMNVAQSDKKYSLSENDFTSKSLISIFLVALTIGCIMGLGGGSLIFSIFQGKTDGIGGFFFALLIVHLFGLAPFSAAADSGFGYFVHFKNSFRVILKNYLQYAGLLVIMLIIAIGITWAGQTINDLVQSVVVNFSLKLAVTMICNSLTTAYCTLLICNCYLATKNS
jgi:hypothetical protein